MYKMNVTPSALARAQATAQAQYLEAQRDAVLQAVDNRLAEHLRAMAAKPEELDQLSVSVVAPTAAIKAAITELVAQGFNATHEHYYVDGPAYSSPPADYVVIKL